MIVCWGVFGLVYGDVIRKDVSSTRSPNGWRSRSRERSIGCRCGKVFRVVWVGFSRTFAVR